MSYTINPDTLSSLLYPVSYRNIEPSAVIQQQVDVYVGGALAGSFLAAQTGTTGSSAVFDTNVQSFLYSDVAPVTGSKTSIFGTLDTYSLTTNTDVLKSIYCVAKNQTVSTAGFLVTSTAGQNSATAYVVPSQFYKDDNDFNLSDFYQPSASPFRFLTTNNQDRRCNADGNIFLSFVGKGVNAGRFVFHQNSGSTAETIIDFLNTTAITICIPYRLERLIYLEVPPCFTLAIFQRRQRLTIIIPFPLVITTGHTRQGQRSLILTLSQLVTMTLNCIGLGNMAARKVISLEV